MWSDREIDDFSAFGRAEKVSVFKGFQRFWNLQRRERWLSPERRALPNWATPRNIQRYTQSVLYNKYIRLSTEKSKIDFLLFYIHEAIKCIQKKTGFENLSFLFIFLIFLFISS